MTQGQPPRDGAVSLLDTGSLVEVEGNESLEQIARGRPEHMLDLRGGGAVRYEQREVELGCGRRRQWPERSGRARLERRGCIVCMLSRWRHVAVRHRAQYDL